VGDSDTLFDVYPVAESWDGAGWTIPAAQPVDAGSLEDVSCAAPGVCTGVGRDHDSVSTVPVAQRLTPDGWRLQAVPVPRVHEGAQLDAVACPTRGRCVAVGSFDRSGRTRTLAMSWTR
jgi:hypothetical protein